ncbi:hypothetical protein B0H14DRAFT_3062462 [Mycena olivaceomarginata]|nr:hypothetical protein B0H14DRAFT_3062462 [Mycena olivaceomarginata]
MAPVGAIDTTQPVPWRPTSLMKACDLAKDDDFLSHILVERLSTAFKRECEIWKSLWKIDQGQHVLPLLGFCQEDGPFPYVLLSVNGTALTYIKNKGDKIDYLKMVKGVARGLQVLHSMDRPVVHGDLKAVGAQIHIVQDITGIPFSQSRGISDSYRWFAARSLPRPRRFVPSLGCLRLWNDCTRGKLPVLKSTFFQRYFRSQILTHEQPYNNIKHTTEVVIRSAKGEHPPRPRDVRVVQRVLCWATEPSQRPTIQEVLNIEVNKWKMGRRLRT